jgi:hypothetical protein
MENNKILSIDFDQKTGLKFNWKFSNLEKEETYFRHYLLITSVDLALTNNFIEEYCRRLKSGDIFTCIYSNERKLVTKKLWKEKTLFENNLFSYFIPKGLTTSSYNKK